MKSFRIVFFGTPEFASAHLLTILNSQHNVIAAYTQPDRPAGRGRKIQKSPVKKLALQHNIPVYQPLFLKRNHEVCEQLARLKPDLMIVIAYGLILPQDILDIPAYGCINVHGSILPRWRGAAPIQRAILAGDKITGITIIQMNEGVDTGDVLLKSYCPIQNTDKASDLHDRLIEIGQIALIQALDQILKDTLTPAKQNNICACYAHKMSKAEAHIDWTKPVNELDCFIRAFNPWPIAINEFDDQSMRVLEAKKLEETSKEKPGTLINASRDGLDITCADGIIRLTHVQLSGSRVMSVQDLLNSRSKVFIPGKVFN